MNKSRARISSQERRRRIIQAAMGLFARQGFKATTTRQIAERAGINEALIFRHFPSKEDVYWAVINDTCQAGLKRRPLPDRFQAAEDDRAIFSSLAEQILRRTAKDRALWRLLLFSALENHRLSHRFFRTYVADYYETLADYIRARVRQGRFRRVDPLLAARGFLGMVTYHILIQELFGGDRFQRFDPRQVSEILSDLWLQGMRNPGSGPRKKAPARG